MPSYKRPTNEQIRLVCVHLQNPDWARYFFERLENPLWIEPLRELGVFEPPGCEELPDGTTCYRVWPPSRYLVRVAADEPEMVVHVFKHLETENPFVAKDTFEAALALPATWAEHLLPRLKQLAEGGAFRGYLEHAAKLVVKFAENGSVTSAMLLLRSAFPSPDESDAGSGSSDYLYFEALQRIIIPSLLGACARDLLEYLGGQVDAWAQKNCDGDLVDPQWHWDLWRPAIEEHEQNPDYHMGSSLVSCLRQAYEGAIDKQVLTFDEALQLLAERRTHLYGRLRIHLIRVFADRNCELAQRTMMDRRLFDQSDGMHEYAVLLRDRFGLLSSNDRARWLKRVAEGPPEDNYREGLSPTERASWQGAWQCRRLYWVHAHLGADLKGRVYAWLAEEHYPESAFFNSYTFVVREGHEEPVTSEALAAMGFQGALTYVCGWRPDQRDLFGPDYGGLGSAFLKYLGTDLAGFSSQARLLQDKPAYVVRLFFRALEEELRKEAGASLDAFAWDVVFDLMQWVLQRRVDENTSPPGADPFFVPHSWENTRHCIANVLTELCKRGPELRLRDKVWETIVPLLSEPAESWIKRDVVDPRTEAYIDLYSNSPVGYALNAVFQYVRWVGDCLAEGQSDRSSLEGGLGRLPEVRKALEGGLDCDSGFGILGRAGYGRWFGLLYWLDKAWLTEHIERIFSFTEQVNTLDSQAGWAAWNSYLVGQRCYADFYRLLRGQYSRAMEVAASLTDSDDLEGRAFGRLGEHLMILFVRGDLGELETGSDQKIIERLLEKAHHKVRTHAIRFIGRSLGRDESVPAEIQRRLMGLWEWYWGRTGKTDAERNPSSSLFGWWFVSEVFPAQWSLEQMVAFTDVVPRPEPDFRIPPVLAKWAPDYPELVITILQNFVAGDVEGWRVPGCLEEIEKVLKAGIAAGDQVRNKAVTLVHELGRLGHDRFRNLL